MAQPLTGLSALAGYQQQIDADSQATAEQRSGDPADPRHSQGLLVDRKPWQANSTQAADGHGPYGPQNQLLADEFWFIQPAGNEWDDPTFDHTPARRAGPIQRGILSGPVPSDGPDDVAFQLRQSYANHGIRTGAGLKALTGMPPVIGQWNEIDQTTPGHTDLQPLGSRQAMSSGFMWGTRDRTQSFAPQNQYGFDSAHQHRRWARSPIEGNELWMRPGGRPMMKSLAGPARPAIGPDSPFEGQDLGAAFGIGGAVLQNVPTEYVPPPSPTLAAPTVDGNDSVVEWY